MCVCVCVYVCVCVCVCVRTRSGRNTHRRIPRTMDIFMLDLDHAGVYHRRQQDSAFDSYRRKKGLSELRPAQQSSARRLNSQRPVRCQNVTDDPAVVIFHPGHSPSLCLDR